MVAVSRIFIRQEVYVDAILCAMHERLRKIGVANSLDANTRLALDADECELHAVARASSDAGVDIPLLWLGDRLKLSSTEQRVLFLLLANELHPASRQLLRQLNTEQVADPTLDAIRRVVYGGTTHARAGIELGSEGALQRLQLITRTDGGDPCPEHRQTVALSRRVKALAFGNNQLDPSLEAFTSLPAPVDIRDLVVSPESAEQAVTATAESDGVVILSGGQGLGRRSLLVGAAREAGFEVMQIDARGLARSREQAQRQLRAVARELILLKVVPLFCHLEALGRVDDTPDRLDLLEAEIPGLILATASRAIARRWRRVPTVIEMTPPSATQLAELWSRAIPEASAGDADVLATMYPIAPGLIASAGAVARRRARGEPMAAGHIAAGVRAVLDERLAGLATRVKITQSWGDLVLPEDQATSLFELSARVRKRGTVYEKWGFAKKVGKGLGVTALFSGPPGTGKTMAACLVAKDLGVDIYQVDLSKIVSKWIGETEQNLAALFDAAEASHAILLFDEADALFGKRTEVRNSNDRHANQEVNFLLQRIESFTGICLLTTNHETSIDDAFRRRLSVHLHFPLPDVDQRKALWRAMLPPEAPVDPGLDLDQLAEEFAMSGGYIKNAVMRAAFLAADGAGIIDGNLLSRAAQLECEAMGRIVFRD